MKLRIDHCYYELVKELLLSNEKLIKSVEKMGDDVLVTLNKDKTKDEFMEFLSKDPLFQFTMFSRVYVM